MVNGCLKLVSFAQSEGHNFLLLFLSQDSLTVTGVNARRLRGLLPRHFTQSTLIRGSTRQNLQKEKPEAEVQSALFILTEVKTD